MEDYYHPLFDKIEANGYENIPESLKAIFRSCTMNRKSLRFVFSILGSLLLLFILIPIVNILISSSSAGVEGDIY